MAREYRLQRSGDPVSRINYAAELNPEQHAAVTSAPGQALVIAGAGSGKTRTLTYRVAYLLDNGIQPENILLLTFTNKAAREMIERVQGLVPVETGRLWSGTFHSIGNKLLRHYADRVGYRSGFSIMDREDQKSLMDSAIAASGVDVTGFRLPKTTVLADLFSLCENTMKRLEVVIDARYPYFEKVTGQIRQIRLAYESKKRETNSLDFDDLLVQPVKLLRENDDVRERFQRQFQFVLVDEFQDTNLLQCELIDLLTGEGGNLMVVGDDAQSIYSWRGADVGHILGFQDRYPRAKIHKIETNYRSVPQVLDLANAVIARNVAQIRKELKPARETGSMLPALVTVDSPGAQASFIAQRILELQDEGVELNEMAVLYRAHFHSLEIQMELTNRGIPFQITSGLRFFEQAHVKDVAAFMKLVVNRQDEVSFLRMARLVPGIGHTSAGRMWADFLKTPAAGADVSKKALGEALHGLRVPKKAAETWQQFAWTLEELVAEDGAPVSPSAMIHSVVAGVYQDYMKSKFDNFDQRMQDLDQLEAFSVRFEDTSELLSQLALLSGVDTDGGPTERSDEEAVTLTTAHQAKGLEWKVVFAAWVADGMFPHSRAVEDGGVEAVEEERRLFYVTVTRAKDELYLCYPLIWHQARDGDILQRPSRFIAELDEGLWEEWNVRSSW